EGHYRRRGLALCGVDEVVGLSGTVIRVGGRSRLPRVLDELGGEDIGVTRRACGVGAWGRVGVDVGESPGQPSDPCVLTPARAGVEVTETRPVLTHDEPQRVTVAVGRHRQELLARPGGLTLHPQSPATALIDAASRVDRLP